ncbi:hypothetical protein WJX73_004837 [Symbiochloris irregularis]|uniref:Uncharacterized protein n=1 Tax=Symbiochloris irregularis TaxID=706552 RepID=A0AAW1NSL3_9CHLO
MQAEQPETYPYHTGQRYELRIYSLEPGSFGQILTSCPIHAAHCLTSVQFSPTSQLLLVSYGRRHISLLRSLVADGASASVVPVHTIVEVYRVADLSLLCVLPSAEDEVNAACFHPKQGHGFAYGTKEGRLRLVRHVIHSETETISLRPEAGTLPSQSRLSHLDRVFRIFLNFALSQCLVIPQRLERERFIRAAQRVLQSYPEIGSRYQLAETPYTLDLSELSFPVSFAEWTSCDATRFEQNYAWRGSLATTKIPDPAFVHPLEVPEALKGAAPLFAVRVTLLGDGCSILAITSMHGLTDGRRLARVFNAFAAAYRGDEDSCFLPAPNVARDTWPWHIAQLLPDLPADAAMAEDSPESQKFLHSQAGLLEQLYKQALEREQSEQPQHDATDEELQEQATVLLDRDDMRSLKAQLQRHPHLTDLPIFSTNDVIVALAWLLKCDAMGCHRPFQGPSESKRKCHLTIDAAQGSSAVLAPPGALGNIMNVIPIECITEHSEPAADADSPEALLDCLAKVVREVRESITAARSPGKMGQALIALADGLSDAGFHELMASVEDTDLMFTNWDQCGMETMDFGGFIAL